ncbi:amidase [Variovorax sp. J2P1-59]|uniref:amidase n=1 Tax=Variovorax flavidus TaxID=3053501 RepID=UPI002576F693|nr:amidase [Variovorax sp. J2P1-59]MDM0077976.1 amidase [Variovorax sp. J2P1-59]
MNDPTDEWHHLTIMELATRIRRRAMSPVALTHAQLERIAALDRDLSSYARVMADSAIAQASTAEAELAAGRYRGPLHGIPIAVKDLFWTAGVPTSAGMAVHRDFVPAEDATVVRRLREAGAVLLGKLQLTEGAYSEHHASVIAPKNPWDAAYWPGISSSGAGVATAAGLCYGAIASDTGGSIRWPSAANGVTGLKPTWGRVSRHGMFALAPTLDHVGTMARSAADAGALLWAIAGADTADPSAAQCRVPDTPTSATQDLRGLRLGIDPAWNGDDVDPGVLRVVAEAIAALCELGARIVPVRMPAMDQAVADWAPLCAVEAAVAHEATYPAQAHAYGPVLASVVARGRTLTAVDHHKLLMRRLALRGRVDALWAHIDVLLTPVHPLPPPTLAGMQTLGERPELVAKLQRYTCPFNLTGHPALTLPGGVGDGGMPIAFQLVGRHMGEPTLLRAGTAYQGITPWHRRHPEAWIDGLQARSR